MALNRKAALTVTASFDAFANYIEKNASSWGLPQDIATDFGQKIDVIGGIVEGNAGIVRDASGNILDAHGKVAVKWNPEEIGRETSGPLEGDADELPYMGGEFSQQENRELSDLQESGQMSAPQMEERKPTPGKQADLDVSLSVLTKLAQDDEAQRLASLTFDFKRQAAKIAAASPEFSASLSKLAGGLEKVQEHLINASVGEDGANILVADEASKAIAVVEEIAPHLASVANSKEASVGNKIARLVFLATSVVSKCDKKMASLLSTEG